MNVGGVQSYISQVQQARGAGPAVPLKATPDTTIESETSGANDVLNEQSGSRNAGPNFHDMTLQELESWRDEQHQKGNELPKGISFAISALSLNKWQINPDGGGLELKDHAELSKSYDMYEQAQKGVDFHLARGDSDRAQTWQNLIDFMSSQQAEARKVDIHV